MRSIVQDVVGTATRTSEEKQEVREVVDELVDDISGPGEKEIIHSVVSELVSRVVQSSERETAKTDEQRAARLAARYPGFGSVLAHYKKKVQAGFEKTEVTPTKSKPSSVLDKLKGIAASISSKFFGKAKTPVKTPKKTPSSPKVGMSSVDDAMDRLLVLVEASPLKAGLKVSKTPQKKKATPDWEREIAKKVESFKEQLKKKTGPRNRRARAKIRKSLRKLDLERYGMQVRTPKKTRSAGPSPKVRIPKHRVSPDDMKRLARMSGRPLPDVAPASLLGIRPIPMRRLQPDSESETDEKVSESADDEKYPAAPLPRVPALGPPATTVAPTVAQPPPPPARIKFLKTLMPHIYKPEKIKPIRSGKPLKGHRKVTTPRREKLGDRSEVYILPHQFEFILYPGVTDSEIRHVVQRIKSHLYSTSNAVITSLLEIKQGKHNILLENYDLRKCRAKTLFNVFRKHAPKRMKTYKRFVLYQHNASGGSLTTATAFSLGYRQFLNF
jgi:hypothetical protein